MSSKNSILVLIVVGLLVYFNSLFNGFVWDDEEQILNNTLVHSLINTPSFFSSSTFNSGGSGSMGGLYYKPLMTFFFSFIYSISGPNAFLFHFFQVLLHIANSIFVFIIFKHFFKKNLMSFLLALIFLIHPINTETVVYISDLQDILFFFFGSLALLLAIKSKLNWMSGSLITLFLLLSLLSKETGAIFLIITGVYIFMFRKTKLMAYIIAAFICLTSYSVLRFLVAGIFFNKHGLSPITTIPLDQRLLNIPQIIVFYLKTFLFPKDLAINQHWAITSIGLNEFFFPLVICVIFFAILISWGWQIFQKNKPLFQIYLFFFLWFSLSLGLHLQIFPLDLTVSDRWFYMPAVGLLALIGIFFNQFKIKKSQYKIAFISIIVLLILTLSVRTMIRNFDWKDGLTLYSHDINVSYNSFDLENNLGVELFRAGKFEEAASHFSRSIQLAPDWWTNWNNLGVMAERQKDYKKAKEYYQKAINNGSYYLAYENIAKIMVFHENPKDAQQFIERSLKILPNNANLWLMLSIAQYIQKDSKAALQSAKNSYFLSPNEQNYYVYSQLSKNLPLQLQ